MTKSNTKIIILIPQEIEDILLIGTKEFAIGDFPRFINSCVSLE